MENKKDFYQALPEFNGFKWVGFWDGLHHFTKQFELGYFEIMANEDDIKTGNINDMTLFNVTR